MIQKGHLPFFDAQTISRGEATRGDPRKVFDWEQAARLIAEHPTEIVDAGLAEDWTYTSGTIWNNGNTPAKGEHIQLYLASTWATPAIEIGGALQECWRWASDTPDWDSDTYWPDEARAILAASSIDGEVVDETLAIEDRSNP